MSGIPFRIRLTLFHETYVGAALTEVEALIIEAAIQREDEQGAVSLLRDWGKYRLPTDEARTCEIAQIRPGTHSYVLGERFPSEEEARRFAKEKGFTVIRVFVVDGQGNNRASLPGVLRKRDWTRSSEGYA